MRVVVCPLTTFAESDPGQAVIFEFSELGGGDAGGGDAGGGDAGGGEAGGGEAGGGDAGGGDAGGGGGGVVVPVCATMTVMGTCMRRETPGPDSHT